jgi:hypothetical protein
MRYQAEGYLSQAAAEAWVAEARRLYTEVIVRMRKDGYPI